MDSIGHMLNHQFRQKQESFIQPCDTGEVLTAYTNGGHQEYDHTTTFRILPFEIFFYEKYLADILSFDAVA